MRKKRVALALVLLAAILGMIAWLARSPDGPVYQGRTARGWLPSLENWDRDTNSPGFVAFREMGTNAMPMLLDVIQSGSPRFQRLIMALNDKQSFVHLPYGEPWKQTIEVSWALYAVGTNARSALPVFTNMLFHTNNVFLSTIALAGIGSEALPVLLTALTNQDMRVRYDAVSSLGFERSDQNVVVPVLIACLQDGDRLVRCGSAAALGQLRAFPDLTVPALTNLLSSSDSPTRSVTLLSLAKFGAHAKQAIPMVKAALNDNDGTVRAAAENALNAIEPEAAAQRESK